MRRSKNYLSISFPMAFFRTLHKLMLLSGRSGTRFRRGSSGSRTCTREEFPEFFPDVLIEVGSSLETKIVRFSCTGANVAVAPRYFLTVFWLLRKMVRNPDWLYLLHPLLRSLSRLVVWDQQVFENVHSNSISGFGIKI